MKARLFKNVVIKKIKRKGDGVLARRNLLVGEIAVRGRIVRRLEQRTIYSFQVDRKRHVDLDMPARVLNHSCNPNLGIRNNVFGGYDFVTMRNIKKGEELCWDYCMSEYKSIAVKKCLCGSKNCRRQIKGFKYLDDATKKKYEGFMARYLIE